MRAFAAAMTMTAALGLIPATASAVATDKTLPGPMPATVVRVVDGDTLTVRVHIWIGQEVETNVRVLGVDTPEIHGRCDSEKDKARQAREMTEKLTADGPVGLSDIQADKYGGRIDAVVRTSAGANLADLLIKAGLGRPYDGDQRGAWCTF
jgi:micrococcal nuclease